MKRAVTLIMLGHPWLPGRHSWRRFHSVFTDRRARSSGSPTFHMRTFGHGPADLKYGDGDMQPVPVGYKVNSISILGSAQCVVRRTPVLI